MWNAHIYDGKEEVRDNEIYTRLYTEPAEREGQEKIQEVTFSSCGKNIPILKLIYSYLDSVKTNMTRIYYKMGKQLLVCDINFHLKL